MLRIKLCQWSSEYAYRGLPVCRPSAGILGLWGWGWLALSTSHSISLSRKWNSEKSDLHEDNRHLLAIAPIVTCDLLFLVLPQARSEREKLWSRWYWRKLLYHRCPVKPIINLGYLDTTYDQSINSSCSRKEESDTHLPESDVPSKTHLSRAGDIAQLVEHIFNIHEALGSIPRTT